MVVTAPVATLWSCPEAPRDVDALAVADDPDIAGWSAAMSPDVRLGLHGRILTQALVGEAVELISECRGWAQVRLPWQPYGSSGGGYPGWVRLSHLAPAPEPGEDLGVVTASPGTTASTPAGPVPLSYGTVLPRLVSAGATATVLLPDGRVAKAGHDALLPWPRPVENGEVLRSARRHLGLAYLWGGTSGWGFDCSGLVHLVLRAHGVTVPRDAADQYAVLPPRPLARAEPGDLYFFARPGQRVHHVGWVSSRAGHMLHAPEGGTVEDELLERARTALLVAAGSPLG